MKQFLVTQTTAYHQDQDQMKLAYLPPRRAIIIGHLMNAKKKTHLNRDVSHQHVLIVEDVAAPSVNALMKSMK